MVEGAAGTESMLVRKTAEEYRDKGYEVSGEILLDFLPGFCADLVARKGDEVIVIEVKSRASLATNPGISELARIIDSKPGWSFELILVGEPEKLEAPAGSQALEGENILGRIEEAEKLLEAEHSEAALLLAWSAWEAATRQLIAVEGVPVNDITSPGHVFDQATFLGLISREEYHKFKELQKYRNAIVHGFSHAEIGKELTAELIETVRKMVADA